MFRRSLPCQGEPRSPAPPLIGPLHSFDPAISFDPDSPVFPFQPAQEFVPARFLQSRFFSFHVEVDCYRVPRVLFFS